MVSTVPHPMDDDAMQAAGARRARLNAAIAHLGITQSELHRRLVEAGERELAFTTVNAWCTGRTPLRQLVLMGILSTLGLPAAWEPEKPSTPTRKPR